MGSYFQSRLGRASSLAFGVLTSRNKMHMKNVDLSRMNPNPTLNVKADTTWMAIARHVRT
jgi:hypothetical protein